MPIERGKSQLDSVSIMHLSSGNELTGWLTYQLDRKFLTPTDAWQVEFNDEAGQLRALIKGGDKIQILVNGMAQCTGYVERIEQAGSMVTLIGRDILGPVVDSYVDPHTQFLKTMTIKQAIELVTKPHGITVIESSDSANLNAITGVGVGYPARPDLGATTLEKCKPKPGEGSCQFLSRILERHSLHIWARGDGSGIVIDKPSFDTPPLTVIQHRLTDGAGNNALRANMTRDYLNQASCVVAWGHAGGSGESYTRSKAIVVNDLIPASPELAEVLAAPANKGAVIEAAIPQLAKFQRLFNAGPLSRPIYLEDKDSKTQAQLTAFARRFMAELRAKALVLHYTVPGHSYQGVPWTVNTLCQVQDEDFGLNDAFWVSGRTFRKSRSGGTTTDLELILPFSLEF